MCKLANPSRTQCKPNELIDINGANSVHTCFVQVPLQLHRRLHLHVVLEEAAAERGLVVGLPQRGLDAELTAVFMTAAGTASVTGPGHTSTSS